MRVRRSIPTKPLTAEQKERALEAQKRIKELNSPLTANQLQQVNPVPQPNMVQRFQNGMRQNPFMRNRMTFEEKYGAYKTNVVETEDIVQQQIQQAAMEDSIIPPSIEEDPNQASPLPPGVVNASEVDSLDEYIKKSHDLMRKEWSPEYNLADAWVKSTYENMSIKELKEAYVNLWGERDISHNNNKKNLIDLVTNLVMNGSQEKEGWDNWDPVNGQDGSVA